MEGSKTKKAYQTEAERRLGAVPHFFNLAPEKTGISENLWAAAKFGYFDNPLPSLFKERLFVYLSRFCEVRYCIARHVGFLIGMGNPSGDTDCTAETVEHVIDLIRSPLPRDEDLAACLQLLDVLDEPYDDLPETRSPEEEAILACASHVFLQSRHATRCYATLQRVFDEDSFQQLLLFLTFVRMAHFWTTVHPELKLEDDIAQLLSVQEHLAECILSDPESTAEMHSKIVSEELEALRKESKQARLLETTLASIGDAVIAADTQGRVTLLNPEAVALTGYSTEEALGKSLEEVFCRDDTGERGDLPLSLGENEGECIIVAKDGMKRPVEKTVSAIRDKAGSDLGSVLVFRDITERTRHDKLLDERAKLAGFGRDVGLALTSESTLGAMLQKCTESMVSQFDASFARIWIASEEDDVLELKASSGLYTHMDGEHSRMRIGEFKIGLIAQERKPHLTNSVVGDSRVHDQDWARKHGLVSFAGYPLMIEDRVLGVMAMFSRHPLSDAALEAMESVASGIALGVERMRSEERLRESELRYRLVGQAANDAIWDWDLLTDQVVWNDGMFGQFGYEARDVNSASSWWLERIHTDDRKRVGDDIHALIESGQSLWKAEYRFQRADGSYASVFDRGRVVQDSRGRAVRMVGSMLDISERKQIERRQAFLADLASATELVEDPDVVTFLMSRMLAEYLEVNQCAYLEIKDSESIVVMNDYSRGVPSPSGTWPLKLLGAECQSLLFANQPIVVCDVESDDRISSEVVKGCQSLGIRSAIGVPLHKNGKFTAGMGVSSMRPRQWTADEIEVVQIVAGRCWESLERSRAQRGLRESEERVRMAVQAADIGTWDLELSTGVLRWSDRCKEVFGLSHDAPIDYDVFLSLLHPDDRERTDAAVQRAFDPKGDGFYKIDYRVIWPDGSVRWIVASGEAIFREVKSKREAVRFVGTVLDITDRKEAEARLQASERFTRTILENTPDCIKVMDPQGRLQMMNKHGLLLMGIEDFSKVRGMEWWSLWPEEGRERLREAVQLARTGATDRFQAACPSPAGDPRWWDVVVAPVVSESGKISRLIAVRRDVSLQKATEEQLRELAARLSNADQRKDEFLATLAHELRNPLAPIRSGLEVMKMARADESMFEEVREMMERQTLQLITLVDDLLDVSRITLGKLELRKSRVELASILTSAQEASRPLVEAADHRLRVVMPSRPIYIDADPNRMAQIISNLLNNAAKYTPRGGEIELSVELIGEEVEVKVRDNGIGIPEGMKEQIFEMFAQVDRSFENSYVGLGIGLTLVKSLVEMHGGRVGLESDGEGKGSSFSVRLPALPEERKPEGPGAMESDGASELKRRVLVVDDNEAAAKMLALVVKMLGNEVRTAADGVEAIEIAADYLPEVILMDLGMPRMSGDEAARHIRKQPWGKDMFLVALTGWGQEKDRQRTAEAGFDRHLVKPSEPDELRKVLREADEAKEKRIKDRFTKGDTR
ncbi:PAS domain S-box protein [Pelagicoccus sp. SDUM812002]|uniref:PAS domain S-box protein n=1 Tax=Pelagicoccus sp. SDUM812002 TaxID=3041266 RepID=UPI00280CCED5|nr:PAS domain S-box protein [Pelagicoccus sp. SDUM812002]MDQ8184773.1 PAS domain S-box protein [Pelagicoccus sp. SDUM812002]